MVLHQQHSLSSLSTAASSSYCSASLPPSQLDMSYKEKTAYMQDDCSDLGLHPARPSSLSSLSSLSLSAAAAAAAASSPSSKSQGDHKADTKESQPSSPSSFSSSLSSSALSSGPADEEEQRYSLFLSWLRSNGAKFPHLTLRRYAADYRGVHISSRAEIAKGKTLLRIPHRLLITVELAKASPLGGLVASLPNIGSQAILAVFLLQERQKGAGSFWKAWLDVLPAAFSTLPMFFSSLELQELQGCSELLSKVRAQQKSMRDEYAAIQRLPGIGSFAPFSYDEFVWAALAVGTRVFSLCINNSKTSVLAPLADMMNHKNPAGSSWSYCNRKESFTLTACCGMADGEAVYESYGIKDNKRFFASYGFCLEENAANEVSVLIKGEMMQDERQSGGGSGGLSSSLSSSRAFTVRQAYDAAMEEMMAFLRCVNAYDHHMDDCSGIAAAAAALSPPSSSSAAGTPPSSSSSSSSSSSAFVSHSRASFTIPLSVDNELSALYALRCACKEHLSAYPSKLEQDVQLLSSLSAAGSSSDCTNYRNILVFRIGEKRIYRWLIDFSSLGIALLCTPWEEARVRIRQMMDSAGAEDDAYAGMMGYVTAVVAPLLQERSKQSRRAMQAVAAGSSAGKSRAGIPGSRRSSQDAERHRLHGGLRMLGMTDYTSRDMDEDDDDDEEDEDEDDGSEKDMTAEAESPHSSSSTSLHFSSAFGGDESGSQSVSPLTSLAVSLMTAPAASKRASLPPVSSSPPAVSRSSSIISTPLPFHSSGVLAPSPSPPSTFSSRHLPRSAGSSSSRTAAPRILPAMPPVARASSHAASLSSSTGLSPHSSNSHAPLAAPIPKLPSMRSSPTIAANSSSAQRQTAAAAAAGASRQQRGNAASATAAATAGSKQALSPSSATPSPSSANARGGVLLSAPSPTPSTSDDSQDEQSTPVDADDSDDGDDSRELGRGDKAPAMTAVDNRRRMHCAQ